MYRAAAGQSPTQGSARRAMAGSDAGSASAPRDCGSRLPPSVGLYSRPLRIAGHFSARIEHVARSPVALDVRQDGPDFIVGELAAKTRHVALVARRRIGRHEPALRDAEEHAVRVMPGVAALIVRRRRQAAVGQAGTPVRLPFQLRAVAGGAVLRIDFRTGADFRCVARVRARIVPRRAHIAAAGEQSERNRPEPAGDENGSDCPWSNRRSAAKGRLTMMDGMGSMMAWMMGLGLLGWVLIIALLVAILVVLVRLLTERKD